MTPPPPTSTLVSLSLPKTGTTFLGSLLEDADGFVQSSIKEPSYFFNQPMRDGDVLRRCLVPGNAHRGREWYDSLYGKTTRDVRVDLSTQYWLHLDAVIANTRPLNPRFVVIERNPVEQLKSYLGHLRRGYIPREELTRLTRLDSSFLNYLDSMAEYGHHCRSILSKHGVTAEFLNFEQFVAKPNETLKEHLGITVAQTATSKDKNERAYPRYSLLNDALFSNRIRQLGRRLPESAYGPLVRLRKRVAKANLQQGEDQLAASDADFIESRWRT